MSCKTPAGDNKILPSSFTQLRIENMLIFRPKKVKKSFLPGVARTWGIHILKLELIAVIFHYVPFCNSLQYFRNLALKGSKTAIFEDSVNFPTV